MDQKSFATKFEAKLKPRIAKELKVYPLGQCYNGDFLTRYGNIIELKIRKIKEDDSCKAFVASKNQYKRITGSMGQIQLDTLGPPTFSYLFVPYNCEKCIADVRNVDAIIDGMEMSKAFLVDNRFVPEHDRSGEKSRFYRVLVKTFEKHTQQKRKVKLLGSDIFLNVVSDDEYLPTLATRLFE